MLSYLFFTDDKESFRWNCLGNSFFFIYIASKNSGMKTIISNEMKYNISKLIILDFLDKKLITLDEFNKVLTTLAKAYHVIDHDEKATL